MVRGAGGEPDHFFIGQCLIRFPHAYEQWRKEGRPANWDSLERDDGSAVDVQDPVDEIGMADQRIDVVKYLRTLDNPVGRILAARVDGGTDREIGDQLGMSPKAVEGVLYRYRRRPNWKGGDNEPARAD